MTNLKKTLAVVLAFAMILSMGAISTFAYTDVAEGTIVSEAVGILSNLNILTGFEDGTFRPDETVTRAQMAAIICRLLGYEDQAKSSMGSTVFNDVAADHWASGYVNVAQAQQIINGYGDGNYGPEDLVTYEQAVKMIVSALGYDLAAQGKGGYPTGYLAIASAEGITKKANGKVGDAAARSTIAVLAYNSLEVPLFEQDSWSTDGTDSYSHANANILTRYLEIVKVEGVLTNVPLMKVQSDNKYDSLAVPAVDISNFNEWTYSVDGNERPYWHKVATTSTNGSDFAKVNADKVDVNPYLGKYVIAYVGEDELTSVDTIYAIVDNSNKNQTVTMSCAQLAISGEKNYGTDGVIAYKEVGSSRLQEIDLDDKATLVTNFATVAARNVSGNTNNGDSISAATIEGQLSNGGTLEFISNDGDTEYDYIILTAYSDEDVIESVEEYNGEYTFESMRGNVPDLDTTEEDGIIVVYKDGVLATVADLAANDTVSFIDENDFAKDCFIIYASSATVTGVVDSYSPDDKTVTIAGTEYKVAKSSPAYSSVSKLSGEEGIFFLNVDGQIVNNNTAPTAVGKYALVTTLYYDSVAGDTVPMVEAVLADGTVAAYEVAKTAKVKKDDGSYFQISSADAKVDQYLKTVMKPSYAKDSPYGVEAYKTTITSIGSKAPVVKLTINNDKIAGIRLVKGIDESTDDFGSFSESNNDVYKTLTQKVGSCALDDATVVFSVKQDSNSTPDVDTTDNSAYAANEIAIDAEDVKVGAVSDFMVNEEKYTGYAYDKDNKVYGAVVGLAMAQPIVAEDAVFVVTNKKTSTIDDVPAYLVTGIQAGEEKTITIYNEDDTYADGFNPSTLEAGDVLLIATPDEAGIVSDIKVVANFDRATTSAVIKNAAGVDSEDNIYYGFGLADLATDELTFSIDQIIKNEATDTQKYAANHTIDFEPNANYTLVDFSEANKPEISVARGNKRLFDDKYVTYAYVRYIDGDVAEVVAYRFAGVAATGISANNISISANDEVTFTVADAAEGAKLTLEVAPTANTTITGKKIKFTAAGTYTVTATVEATGYIKYTDTFTITVS